MMTVAAAIIGLMPIMWSTGAGADVMKRIAAPMVGGLATSFLLELLVYPAIYLLWKWGSEVRHQTRAVAPVTFPAGTMVAKPTKQSVTDYDENVGAFHRRRLVEIRARVSGYLEKVQFKDGEIVKQGDLLFAIDRRPFEATLAQARANLAQARANLAFATSDLARAAQLVRDRTITEQTFDQRTQAKSVAEASVAAQEAAFAPSRTRSPVHRAEGAGDGPDR